MTISRRARRLVDMERDVKRTTSNGSTARGVVCLALLWIALVSGCASTPTRFYTLSAMPGAVASPSDLSVSVGPVAIPAIVDRPQFIVRVGANQVAVDEFNQWASPLQNNIARVVAENLTAMLGTERITLSSQILGVDAVYRAMIDVQRFDSTPGEGATFDAAWMVLRSRDGVKQTGRTTAREASQEPGYAALAAAHSRAVARLSQDIADAVRTIERSAQ